MNIAFLLDNDNLSNYNYNLIKIAQKHFENDEICLIFDDINQNIKKIKNIKVSRYQTSIFKSLLKRIVFFFEKKKLDKLFSKNNYGKRYNANELNLKKINIDCIYSKSGLFKSFENNINLFKTLNIDLLIRGNTGILKGEILEVSKLGILSPHHGDNRYFKGGPAGFWEVYQKSNKSGFIIHEINSKLDDGNILEREEISTEKTWWVNRYILQKKSLNAWNDIFNKIKKREKLKIIVEDKKIINNKINKYPKFHILLYYFLKNLFTLKYF